MTAVLAAKLSRCLQKSWQNLLPFRCLQCLAPVGEQGTLCSSCWLSLNFITPPYCLCCGRAFEYSGSSNLCVFCLKQRPTFHQCRSALVYDDQSKHLILRFKHNDHLWGTQSFASWMARAAGSELLRDSDLLIPVPLHWSRLVSRRYNQAALLSNAISKLTGIAKHNHILKRLRATPSQGHRTREQRIQNVAKAFFVPERERQAIAGNSCLLIDDVYTTGATVQECARALKRAGAKQVNVLTLARVV